MRKPPNERSALAKRTPAKAGVQPSTNDSGLPPSRKHASASSERKCILSGRHDARDRLIRLALGPDGQVAPDVRARAPGRGAWIGVGRAELEAAQAKGKLKGALARAFKTGDAAAPGDLGARIEEALARHALDRLGLEARGGTLVTGSERIEAAARAGQVRLLLHAADAGADGNRKLDQALRVGRDAEGSGARGLVIPADRTTLSVALGRENVVHVAVIDRGAADRVRQALDRWTHFIDQDSGDRPCETASQGSSPHATSAPAADGI